MPIIVVLPGIAAVILFPDIEKPDQAYPSMMSLMPVGIKGLVFAALVAAIVSSLASMTNSISTIFTMDIYRPMRADKDENHYVNIGRLSTVTSLIVAVCVAQPLIGQSEQAFQYIQEFTGLFSPGITVIFLMGMFWKRTTSSGALAAAIGSALFSVLFAVYVPELPFMDRIGIVFLMCLGLTYFVSARGTAPKDDSSVDISDVSFATTSSFNIAGIGCVLILIGLYATWW